MYREPQCVDFIFILFSLFSVLCRYKDCYFPDDNVAREAKEMLLQELQKTFDAETEQQVRDATL